MTEAIQRNFNLYPADLETLNQVAQRFNGSGKRNLSQALRFIIDEWRKEQGESHDAQRTVNG